MLEGGIVSEESRLGIVHFIDTNAIFTFSTFVREVSCQHAFNVFIIALICEPLLPLLFSKFLSSLIEAISVVILLELLYLVSNGVIRGDD